MSSNRSRRAISSLRAIILGCLAEKFPEFLLLGFGA